MTNDQDTQFLEDLAGFDLKSLDRVEKDYRASIELVLGLAAGTITQREALGISSESIQRVMEYGYTLLEKEYYAHAAIVFDGLVALDPNVPYFHLALGAALKSAGQIEAAMQEWEIARRLDPTDLTAYVNQAQVLLDGGRSDAALSLMAHARTLDTAGRHPLSRRLTRLWMSQGQAA